MGRQNDQAPFASSASASTDKTSLTIGHLYNKTRNLSVLLWEARLHNAFWNRDTLCTYHADDFMHSQVPSQSFQTGRTVRLPLVVSKQVIKDLIYPPSPPPSQAHAPSITSRSPQQPTDDDRSCPPASVPPSQTQSSHCSTSCCPSSCSTP